MSTPQDRQVIAMFRDAGVHGDIETFELAPNRFFAIGPDEFDRLSRVSAPSPLSQLAGQLEKLFGQPVAIGTGLRFSSGRARKLGCPICDRHEPDAVMHQNCVLR